MNRTYCVFFSLAILVSLVGCAPATISPGITYTVSASATPALEIIAATETTLAVQPSLTPTPGANISVVYLLQGGLHQYNLRNGSTEKLSIQSDRDIFQAVLSSNQRWLAFQDRNGINIVEPPFTGKPRIIPIAQVDGVRFSFSNNSEFLAYSDDEGLKIFNVFEETSSLLVAHSTDPSDVSKFRFYYPQQWSPDSQWLWIGVNHWEGVSHVLAHIPTKTFHEYSGCYSDIDWFEESQAFVATVRYSDYLGCGNDDGIYLLELKNNNQVAETRIFQVIVPTEASQRESLDIILSPNGEKIAFVQLSHPEQKNRSSQLMLINVLNHEHKELDTNQDGISSPVWSNDGTELFYTVQGEKESQVLRLNLESGEENVLSVLPNKAVLFSNMIVDDWLVAGTTLKADWDSLYLVNIQDGAVIKVSTLGYDRHVQPFLGVWSSQ